MFKKRKNAPHNKKHLNNKVLKAREILAKNHEVQQRKESENAGESTHKRSLSIFKKFTFWLMIAALVILILTFVLIKSQGGTPTMFGYSFQRISSGSMEPVFSVGDIILCKQPTSPTDIEIGDIITYQGDDKLITHRVIEAPHIISTGEWVLKTRGDANSVDDSEITYSKVKFFYVSKLDFLNKFYTFFLSPWGLVIFIAVLLIIFFDDLITIIRVLTGHYDEEDDDDEDFEDTVERRVQEEQRRFLEERKREKKLRKPQRFDNTSNRRKKNRKKNATRKAVHTLPDHVKKPKPKKNNAKKKKKR